VRLLIDQLSAISDLDILGALAGVHANFECIYNHFRQGQAQLARLRRQRGVLLPPLQPAHAHQADPDRRCGGHHRRAQLPGRLLRLGRRIQASATAT
jgi:hypothetical protein